ncbi:MAG TPA: transglycosylase SLT domain-containing protein [Gemmataceae bacterium]|nr:transglycosylase SLT domain-containing protein [Gemmataceae bacterium]
MRNLRGTYVHRGDVVRRRRRLKQTLLVLGFCVATGVIAASREPATVNAEPTPKTETSSFFITPGEARRLENQLADARGELDMVKAQFDRATRIIDYSKHYDIGAGMASSIFDTALGEGVDPDLAFRLVRLESEFNPRAKSSVGAIGLTQLMPSTARLYQKGVSVDQLYNGETNLKIGFRYLHNLLKLYGGNVELALVAYNRGEDAVDADRRAGRDPRNGYQKKVMGNYKGRGIIQQGQKR